MITNQSLPNTCQTTHPTESAAHTATTNQTLPRELKIAKTSAELERIETFRKSIFANDYPAIGNFKGDRHDAYSIIMFTENSKGDITSTARIIFDSNEGFPADGYVKDRLDQYRKTGINLVEVGRFAISDEARAIGLLPIYYRAFYQLAIENNIDSIVIVINNKSVNFHKKRIGASILLDRIDNIAGSKFQFTCMEWKLNETKEQFLDWAGCESKPQRQIKHYSIQQWNTYSRCFASIMSHVQRELYHETVKYLKGRVIDLGAGVARLAPLLVDNPVVSHYTAVEQATDMVEIAQFTLQKLGNPNFSVQHQRIEDTKGLFDSAVALQSFYTWDHPQQTLAHIAHLLKPNGLFVLATPNLNFDQQTLLHDAEKELMWHPDFEAFKEINLQLAYGADANFISMDDLIRQLQKADFVILSAHTNHYKGGVNFVTVRKRN